MIVPDRANIGSTFNLHENSSQSSGADSELKATKWKLEQMVIKMDLLQNDNKDLHLKCNRYEDKVIALCDMCRSLRNSVEKLSREKNLADAKVTKLIYLEERVKELQVHNENLEDELISCAQKSLPGYPLNVDNINLDVANQNAELKSRCEHLQKVLETTVSSAKKAKSRIVTLQNDKVALQGHLERCRTQLRDVETAKSILEDKIRSYYDEDSVGINAKLAGVLANIEEHEQPAFTDRDNSTYSVENGRGYNHDDDVGVKKEMNVTNLKLMQEIERFKEMWEVETKINDDLLVEIRDTISSLAQQKPG